MEIFECSYCGKKYTRSVIFANHICTQMKRSDIMKTVIGTVAFQYYKFWLSLHKSKIDNISTFITSIYFNAFIEFIKFCRKVNIPDKEGYIKLMKTSGILPTGWCDSEVHVHYIQHYDLTRSPMEQAETTIETLFDLSRIFECDVNMVFNYVHPGDIISLVQSRKLSPWLLLFSGQFGEFLIHRTTPEQKMVIETIINPIIWKEKIKRNRNDVDKLKIIIRELKL